MFLLLSLPSCSNAKQQSFFFFSSFFLPSNSVSLQHFSLNLKFLFSMDGDGGFFFFKGASSGVRPQLDLILSNSIEPTVREESAGWLWWEISSGLQADVRALPLQPVLCCFCCALGSSRWIWSKTYSIKERCEVGVHRQSLKNMSFGARHYSVSHTIILTWKKIILCQ